MAYRGRLTKTVLENIGVTLAAAVLFALAALSGLCGVACTGTTPAQREGPAALAALIATPANLPATAKLGALSDVRQLVDSSGAVVQQLTDPDALWLPPVPPATAGSFVLAIHEGQNISVRETLDGYTLRPRVIALRPTAGTWNAQGIETPSIQAPTPVLPVWTMLVSTYPNAVGLQRGRYKAISLAVASDWRGPWKWVTEGPVMGPLYKWASPWVDSGGYLDCGLDEPAHVFLGATWVALVSGTSYKFGQAPQLGLATSLPHHAGRAWLVEPDPVVASVGGLYITQADLVQDPRDASFHAFVTRAYVSGVQSEEGIHHLWSTDLRTWVEPDPSPIVRTLAGTSRAGRCFGSAAAFYKDAAGAWRLRLWWAERKDNATSPWTLATGLVDV